MKKTARPTLFSAFGRRDLRSLLHPQKALDPYFGGGRCARRGGVGLVHFAEPELGIAGHRGEPRAEPEGEAGEAAPGRRHHGAGWPRRGCRCAAAMCARTSATCRSTRACVPRWRCRWKFAGRSLGLLNVDSTEVDAFSATDEERLIDMALEAAKWLELAWEIDQLRLKSRQLTSLVDTAQMIISEKQCRRDPGAGHSADLAADEGADLRDLSAQRRYFRADPARLPWRQRGLSRQAEPAHGGLAARQRG